MRIVRKKSEVAENLPLAIKEAEANFADGRVFIERYIENPRHIELQLLADGNGNVAVLGERDCTVQRNRQKLIEESPSPVLPAPARQAMLEGAVNLFSSLNYRGAGTIEFLMDGAEFYFMEVNARIQVEHPVSELVSGIDIIREQITACTTGSLSFTPQDVRLTGAAIECRINALSPGCVTALTVPGGPGVRFDSFLYEGCAVPPYYDSMVAKLITYDTSSSGARERALARMNRALDELVIEGIKTNIEEQRLIINHPVFRAGKFGTSFIENYIDNRQP
jgi:acetyl-CoA carboxylase biotin carboxylase subunit